MKHTEYQKHVKQFVSEMQAVTKAKNADYSAGSDDAMQNYYELANASGCTPLQSWMVLMTKHLTAIMRFVKTGNVSSEAIHGRMIDMANYALLGDALITDLTEKGLLDEIVKQYRKKKAGTKKWLMKKRPGAKKAVKKAAKKRPAKKRPVKKSAAV